MSNRFIKGKVHVWLGAVDATRPAAPNIAPAEADWTPLGVDLFDDAGLNWQLSQEITSFGPHNSVFKSAAFRDSAGVMFSFTMQDFTAEVLAKAMNSITPGIGAADATNVGFKELKPGSIGVEVAEMAVLVRVDSSPYSGDSVGAKAIDLYVTEWYSPRAYESSNFDTALSAKGDVAKTPFEFMGLLSQGMAVADADKMGSWRITDADTTS